MPAGDGSIARLLHFVGKEGLWIAALGLGMQAALMYLVSLGDLSLRIPALWSALAVAFLGYGIASAWCLRRPGLSLPVVLLLALLFRLTMLASPASLSGDVYRYVWDGRVQSAGINPYAHAPDATALAHLRDDGFQQINHRQIPTIYPPLSQLYFRLVCLIDPSPLAMKIAFVLADVGIVAVLLLALRHRRQAPSRILLYAWNPLPIIEVAGNGHLDSLAILLLLLAAYALSTNRKTTAVWALAGAFLSKLVPLLALPLFWRRIADRPFRLRERWVLAWFPALTFVGFALFADVGSRLFTGLFTYLHKWRFNDALFSLGYGLLKDPELAIDDSALELLRRTFAGLLIVLSCWAGWRVPDPFRALFVILGTYVLLSPTLHPWYLLWILPFMALFPNLAWLLLSALIFLAYEVLIGYGKDRVWIERDWVKWAQFVPFYLVLVATPIYRRWRPSGAAE